MTPSNLPQEEGSEFSDSNPDLMEDEVEEKIERYPVTVADLIDAYRKVKAHILLRFRSREGQEFFACVQRDWRQLALPEYTRAGLGSEGDLSFAEQVHRRYLIWSESVSWTYNAHGQEQTVFVDVIESMEQPQEQISSLIWFDTVENFECLLPKTWYTSVQGGFPVSFGRMRDWELCVGSDALDQSTSEVVERTTKAMKYIADYQWNTTGNLRNLPDVVRDISSLRIGLGGGEYRISVPQFSQDGIELVDMLFGPIVLV